MILDALLSFFLLYLLLNLKLSDSFLNGGFKRIHLKGLKMGDSSDDAFREGLKLWNKYFESIRKWETVAPSNTAFTIAMTLNFGTAKEMIEAFEKNSWMLLVFPMIPDLMVERFANVTGCFDDKISLSEEEAKIAFKRSDSKEEIDELQLIVNFFLKHRFYRQLAALIILIDRDRPLNWFHLRDASAEGLIGIFDHLFCLKSDAVEEFFGPVGKDKMFLLAPLIASTHRDEIFTQAVIKKFAEDTKIIPTQIVAQVGIGFLLADYAKVDIYERNEKLVDFLTSVLKIDNLTIKTALKACRIINLIKMNPLAVQKILLSIYMDEDEAHVEMLFTILKKIISVTKSTYYAELIESFRIASSNKLKLF